MIFMWGAVLSTVKSGDLLTVIGAIAIVVVIALVARPQYLSGILPNNPLSPVSPTPVYTPNPTPVLTPAMPGQTQRPSVPTPVPTVAPPYRIFYTDKPLAYPVFNLPENMNVFGASDIPLRNSESVTFAYVEGSRGGLTQTFTVPYPVWVINTTVISNINPQYGNFRMALCYAKNGTVIEGQEILNRGTSYHVVQVSNEPMYMIISTTYIDSYRINLETARPNYDQYRKR
jgi:hypothetical protein